MILIFPWAPTYKNAFDIFERIFISHFIERIFVSHQNERIFLSHTVYIFDTIYKKYVCTIIILIIIIKYIY